MKNAAKEITILFIAFFTIGSVKITAFQNPTINYNDKYIESVNITNNVITKKRKNVNDIAPTITIRFKNPPSSVIGYILDSYGNAIDRLYETHSEIPNKKEYILRAQFDDNYVYNGSYYVRMFIKWDDENGNEIHSEQLKCDYKINIPENTIKNGFYMRSPNSKLFNFGNFSIDSNLSDKKDPIIAWVDTINKNVKKYQLFLESSSTSNMPYIDNINAQKREIIMKNYFMNKALGGGWIRAVFKDGSYKDTEGISRVNYLYDGM